MERRSIAAEVAAKRGMAQDVLRFIEPGMDIVVGAAHGEPIEVVNAIEAASSSLHDVRLHQMIPLRPRAYITGSARDSGTCRGFSHRRAARRFIAANATSFRTRSATCRG
jgi:hypothetical protein